MIRDVEHEVEARHFAMDTEGVRSDRQWFEHDVEALIRPQESTSPERLLGSLAPVSDCFVEV